MAEEKPSFLQILAGRSSAGTGLLFDPFLITDRVYKDQQLNLDGYTFKNCAFINCHLAISNANFSLDKCYFQNSRVFLSGNALKTVKLTALFARMEIPDSMRAQLDPDNAVTII
ncbi:MAG: hypothetical protein LAO78_09775 [Acidobacteriia bacterium]|nr:hypothetical protein [Terriglobia bacterium]